jgi:hypothetical protein
VIWFLLLLVREFVGVQRGKAVDGSRVDAAEQIPHPRRSGHRDEGGNRKQRKLSGPSNGRAGFGTASREGGDGSP